MDTPSLTQPIARRVAALPWPEVHAELDVRGIAQTPVVLTPDECRQRPARGRRGFHRAATRARVSALTRGQRTTLGVIFHDAR